MSVSIRENGECTAMAGYTIPESVHASETPAALTKYSFLHTLDGKEDGLKKSKESPASKRISGSGRNCRRN